MKTLCEDIKTLNYGDYRNIMRSGLDIYDSAALLDGATTIFSVVQDKLHNKQNEFKKGEVEFFRRETKNMVKQNLVDWFHLFKNKIVTINKYPGIYQHDNQEFIICKPEYSIVENGKECGSLITIRDYIDYQWDNIEQGKVPDNYTYYAQHMMAVMGWEKVFVFIYNSMMLEYREIQRDQFMIDFIITSEIDLWKKYIVNKENPPIKDKDVALINQIIPKKQEEKECSQIIDKIEKYILLTKKINENSYLDKDRKALQGEIKIYLDGAISGKCSGYKINNDKQFRITQK